MKPGEQAELERQGAKAAVRGDEAGSNPLLLQQNMPASTGEALQEWGAQVRRLASGLRAPGPETSSTRLDAECALTCAATPSGPACRSSSGGRLTGWPP